MAKSSAKSQQMPSKSRNGRGYRCIFRAFVRACGNRAELDVLKAAGVGGKTQGSRKTYLGKLRNGVPVERRTFQRLATVLNCEPTYLYFTPEDSMPRWDSPSYKFALRVAELLEDETIPMIDPDTNQPPDVVRYAWEMGDPVLDSMQLTFKEQREAFLFLRDYLMSVIELPTDTRRKHQRPLGVMVRGAISKDDLIADIRARKATSLAAFDILEEAYDDKNPFHINRIRSLIPHRFDMYLDAIKLDDTQWKCRNQQASDPEKRLWSGRSDYVAIELVRNVIDADFHLRKVIFPTYQQDLAFAAYYSRSRQLIEWMHLNAMEEFPTWWNLFRERNTEELREFVEAWLPAEANHRPKWEAMRTALENNLQRTEDEIWANYPDTLLPKSKRLRPKRAR